MNILLALALLYTNEPQVSRIIDLGEGHRSVYANSESKHACFVDGDKGGWKLRYVDARGKAALSRRVGNSMWPTGTDSKGRVIFKTVADYVYLTDEGDQSAVVVDRDNVIDRVEGGVYFDPNKNDTVRVIGHPPVSLPDDLRVVIPLGNSTAVLCVDSMGRNHIVDAITGATSRVPDHRSTSFPQFRGMSSECTSLDAFRAVGMTDIGGWNEEVRRALPTVGTGTPEVVLAILNVESGLWSPLAVINRTLPASGEPYYDTVRAPRVAVFNGHCLAVIADKAHVLELN